MSTSRQLAAILFADIEGFTALMQNDEDRAMMLRDKFQQRLEHEIKNHSGRVVHFSGDGALCIFQSAIEAVRAAEAIQLQMLQEPNVPLRIGIHTGDVITEGENVYGDGVNVASRIESFAVPGAVFVSGKVYDEIKNHKEISSVPLGRFELKNVVAPVEIFAVSNEGLVVPSKKKKLEGKGRMGSRRKRSFLSTFMKAMALVAIALLLNFLVQKYFKSSGGNSSAGKTIAVLPFANLSESKDDEYFSDGMCDEILTQLSKISSLNVLSRTSTLQFRDTKLTTKEIGEKIGADALLEGSVQKSNDKIRINVQLIDAKTDKHLWAETYDKDFKDIFTIQSDVAKSVAEHLAASLTADEKARIEKKPTENLQAYNLYLKGNYLIRKVTPEDLDSGLAMMNRAIKLDSTFALPYLGIAYYYIVTTDFYLAPNDAMPKLKYAAQTAIKMDSTLGQAYAWFGLYEYWYAYNWKAAETEFKKAVALSPNDYFTHFSYSQYLITVGRIDEAKMQGNRMVELEPLAPEEAAFDAMIYYYAREYDQALQQLDKATQLDPNFPFIYFFRAQCHIQQGKTEQAVEENKKANELFQSPWSYGRLAYTYARTGNTKLARAMLDTLEQQSKTKYVASDVVASVYVALGEKDRAFEYLQKAIDEHAGWMVWINVDPIWDPLHSDPRYTAILNKMDLKRPL